MYLTAIRYLTAKPTFHSVPFCRKMLKSSSQPTSATRDVLRCSYFRANYGKNISRSLHSSILKLK